jgi:hypothetical protein
MALRSSLLPGTPTPEALAIPHRIKHIPPLLRTILLLEGIDVLASAAPSFSRHTSEAIRCRPPGPSAAMASCRKVRPIRRSDLDWVEVRVL